MKYLLKDGAIDCADNSDESPALCGYSTDKTPTIKPTLKPTVSPIGEEGSCQIPLDLEDTVRVFYEANENLEISKGANVAAFATVIYKCKTKYVLEGNTTNFCLDGQWVAGHPTCRKYCSPLPISGATIRTSCEIFGETISCQQQHRPKTIARITCAVGYRKPTDRTVVDVLRCDDDGEWDYHAFRCEQICGLEGKG